MHKSFLAAFAALTLSVACQAQVINQPSRNQMLLPITQVNPISATDPAPTAYGYIVIHELGQSQRAPIIAVFRENQGVNMQITVWAVKDTTTYDLTFQPTGLGFVQFNCVPSGPLSQLSIFDATSPISTAISTFDSRVAPPAQPGLKNNGFGGFNTVGGRFVGVFHVGLSDGKRSLKIDGAFNTP